MSERDECREEATAICGAYLMVAFADARYEDAEEARLLSTFINDPALAHIDSDALASCYNDLVKAFRGDYAAIANRVIAAISAAKHDEARVSAVKKAARLAVVADNRILPQEEAALGRIGNALGLEAGQL